MVKLISKKTTTTVTEEVKMVPAAPGEEKKHRLLKVSGYGSYRGSDGEEYYKPRINLNGKWLADAGFNVGDQLDVTVVDNEIVIRRLHKAE